MSSNTHNILVIVKQQGLDQVNNSLSNYNRTAGAATQTTDKLGNSMNQAKGKTTMLGDGMGTVDKGAKNAKKGLDSASQSTSKFGSTADQTAKKTDGLAGKFQRNKGIIFGLTMLSSGVIEAAGMWSMYADQQKKVTDAEAELARLQQTNIKDTEAYQKALIKKAEATEKIAALEKAGKTNTVEYQKARQKLAEATAELTEMEEKGIEGTDDYKKASDELADAQKGLRFIQRNMILSLTDLIPMTLMSVSGFLTLSETLKKTKEPMDAVRKSTGALATVTPTATTGIKGMGTALNAVKWGVFGLAIAGIGAAIMAIHTNFMGARDAINALGKAIGDAIPFLQPFLNLIKGLAGQLGLIPPEVKTITDNKLWDSTATVDWATVVKDSIDQIKKQFGVLRDTVVEAFNDIKDRIMKGWDALKKGDIPAVINGIVDAFNDLKDMIGPSIQAVVDVIVNTLKDPAKLAAAWNTFKEALWDGGQWVNSAVSSIAGAVKGVIVSEGPKWWDGFKNALHQNLQMISNSVRTIGSLIANTITTDGPTWWKGFQEALKIGGTWVNTGVNAIAGHIKGAITPETTKTWWVGFWSAMGEMGDYVNQGVNTIASLIKGAITVDNAKTWWAGFQQAFGIGGTWVNTGISAIGQAIKGGITPSTAVLWWKGFQDAFKDTAKWIDAGITAFGKAITSGMAASVTTKWWQGFRDAMTQTLVWVTNGVTTIGSLIANKITAGAPKWWVGFQNALGSATDWVKTQIAKVADAIIRYPWGEVGKAIWTLISKGISSAVSSIGQAAGGIIDTIKNALFGKGGIQEVFASEGGGMFFTPFIDTNLYKQKIAELKTITVQATQAINAMFTTMANSITQSLANIGNALTAPFTPLQTHAQQITSQTSAAFVTMETSIKGTMTRIAGVFPTAFTQLYTHAAQATGQAIQTFVVMQTGIQGALSKITALFTPTFANLRPITSQATTQASATFLTMQSSIQGTLNRIAALYPRAFTPLPTATQAATRTAGGHFASFGATVQSVMSSASSRVSSFGSAAQSAFNRVKSSADSAAKSVKALQSSINSLRDKTVTITVRYRTVGGMRFGGAMIADRDEIRGFAQQGMSFINSKPRKIGGVNISEFSKPELVTVTPLSNPNNALDRSINIPVQAPNIQSITTTSGGGQRGQPIQLSGPLYVTIRTQSGKVLAQEVQEYLLEGYSGIT